MLLRSLHVRAGRSPLAQDARVEFLFGARVGFADGELRMAPTGGVISSHEHGTNIVQTSVGTQELLHDNSFVMGWGRRTNPLERASTDLPAVDRDILCLGRMYVNGARGVDNDASIWYIY